MEATRGVLENIFMWGVFWCNCDVQKFLFEFEVMNLQNKSHWKCSLYNQCRKVKLTEKMNIKIYVMSFIVWKKTFEVTFSTTIKSYVNSRQK